MFQKAVKKAVKLKLALMGVSGSGKTYSALRLAKGLGGKIAVIDTENGSASLYSDQFEFDVVDLKPPFTIEKYVEAINAAEKAGYENLIIDSLTHAWAGEGGLLEQKAALDSKPGSNTYTNWGPITKKDNAFRNAFLHSNCNIIATMRSKQEIALQQDSNGKTKPVKLGMAAVQREGLEYEFTIVFDINMNHDAESSKDRTGLFSNKLIKITEDTGKEIKKWLDNGAAEIKTNISSILSPEIQKLANKPSDRFDFILTIGKNAGKNVKDISSHDLAKLVDYMLLNEKIDANNRDELELISEFLQSINYKHPQPNQYKD